MSGKNSKQQAQAGPRPGKTEKPFAICSGAYNGKCPFGHNGWKYYPVPPTCKCGLIWGSNGGMGTGKRTKAKAGKGKSNGNGKKHSKDSAVAKVPPANSEEAIMWKLAQDSPAIMDEFKKKFPESTQLLPPAEVSPTIEMAKLANNIKQMEEKIAKTAKKVAEHQRLAEEGKKAGASTALELEDARARMAELNSKIVQQPSVPAEPFKFLDIEADPIRAKIAAENPAWAEMHSVLLAEWQTTLKDPFFAKFKAMEEKFNELKNAVQEPAAAGASNGTGKGTGSGTATAQPQKEEPGSPAAANLASSSQTVEQKAKEAEAEKQAKRLKVEQDLIKGFSNDAAALKKARIDEAGKAMQCG